MPKSVAYTGDSFNITTYSVDFSTAPPAVAGIPTFATTTTYWVAAVPGTGFDVFSMPTSPAGAISFVGTATQAFSAPTRRVRQPGTADTLDPLDGRIESSVVQDGRSVWFANDVDDNGFPTVLYGAINVSTGRVTDALAYHSSSSDDFNPSIGVSDQGNGTVAVWVNWAYTTSSAGVPVSDTIFLGGGRSCGVQLLLSGRADRALRPGVLHLRLPVGDGAGQDVLLLAGLAGSYRATRTRNGPPGSPAGRPIQYAKPQVIPIASRQVACRCRLAPFRCPWCRRHQAVPQGAWAAAARRPGSERYRTRQCESRDRSAACWR
jgi:hypothetical protein